MGAYKEIVVHFGLAEQGMELWLVPGAAVVQQRGDLGWAEALYERYVWGRSYAATRVADDAGLGGRRLALFVLSPLLPLVIASRTARIVWSRDRTGLWRDFLPVVPHLALLTAAWSVGEAVGYLTAHPA